MPRFLVGGRDLKTLTIWFQNKRQTVARSNRRQLESEGAGTSTSISTIATTAEATTGIDMLASASATMSPLVATVTEKPSSMSSTFAGQLDSCTGEPCSFLDQDSPASSQLLPATTTTTTTSTTTSPCVSTPKPRQLATFPLRVPLSVAVAYDPNVSPSPEIDLSTSAAPWACSSSSSPELQRKPRLVGHDWPAPVHPEDLWKHIPSSPAQPALSSSPDVSPKIDAPTSNNGSTRHSLQRTPTLEWACARSAKRRRTKPDDSHFEDGETDSEWGDTVDRTHSTFRVSEARVPLECYDKYPLDIVRGAILLLGLRDARGLRT
jgi:hypothetical protein